VVVVLVRCGPASPSHCLALHWFQSCVGRQESTASKLEEWTVCPPLSFLWRWLGCSCVSVFLTLFPRMVLSRCLVQAPNCYFGNPFLGAVRGGTGVSEVAVPSGEMSFSLGCLVSLGVTPGCSFPTLWRSGMLVLCLASACVDSVGSAEVVFGLTQVVVEFLLLWLVRDWLSLLSLVREAHPPTLFR
ncbi:hypothetical protein Taro_043971, partial [Colocasia esculenta]|nr:hypothetical protein [Colocasia esculenta]